MHAFMRSSRAVQSEDDVPSWLRENREENKNDERNVQSYEHTPLLHTNNRFEGDGVFGADVEVDYGDSSHSQQPAQTTYGINQETADIDTSWADNSNEEESGNQPDTAMAISVVGQSNDNAPWVKNQNTKNIDNNKNKSYNVVNEYNQTVPSESKPKRNGCHKFFICIQVLGAFGNLAMIIAQVLPLINCEKMDVLQIAVRCYLIIFFLMFLSSELEVTGDLFLSLSNWISRGFLYTFFGAITMEQHKALSNNYLSVDQHKVLANDTFRTEQHIASENNTFTMQEHTVSENNTLTMEQHKAVENNTSFLETIEKDLFIHSCWNPSQTQLFVQISSWLIICLGVLYFFMGITCLQRVRNRLRENYKMRLVQYRT